jgi:hypothetical protein
MSLGASRLACLVLIAMLTSCADRPSGEMQNAEGTAGEMSISEPVDADCVLPSPQEILLEEDGAVLQVWSFTLEDVHSRPVLPDDSGLLDYRAAIRADGADVRRPVSDALLARTPAEAEISANENYNIDLAFSGEVGSIDPITCLDALLFAEQNGRISQLDRPTEFLASVLRSDVPWAKEVIVVFGAGDEMFPPKSVYGFEIVDEYLARGWRFWYSLHNHTLQENGGLLALGTPVPSTSDVQLVRSLAQEKGLESVRVTNGFYTFNATVDELSEFRAR